MRSKAHATIIVLMVRITHGAPRHAARVNSRSALTNSQCVPRSQPRALLSIIATCMELTVTFTLGVQKLAGRVGSQALDKGYQAIYVDDCDILP